MSKLFAARVVVLLMLAIGTLPIVGRAAPATLEDELRAVPPAELAAQAGRQGDAARGAVLFFQTYLACAKCHAVGDDRADALGPNLANLGPQVSSESLVESVLWPSKVIRRGFEPVTVVTSDGQTLTGLLVKRTPEELVMRDLARGGETITLPAAELEEVRENAASIMPAGQVNQLASRQQFLDLLRYLIELRDGGPARARQLQPAQSLLAPVLPEYEQHLDHAALIGGWNDESWKRGEAIYQRVCANCHGTREQPGSLPTSLRFAEGKFKNGSDPLSMYQTLTRGFGLMAAQGWMVPTQKYDVIHYIRETYLRPHNPTQWLAVDADYLARLPRGDTTGPAPSNIESWLAMDYGPSLTHTYEVPGPTPNFAYKGIAVRLDPGAGGVSRGRNWMIFDTDTLRVAAAWSGGGKESENFIDWRGIQFNGEHGVHPRIVGALAFANSTGPGWADPANGQFADDRRVVGRDGRRYGPLPRDWARYLGMYHFGQQVVLSYTVGGTHVLESPRLITDDERPSAPLFARSFDIGPRDHDLVLQVLEHEAASAGPTVVAGAHSSLVRLPADTAVQAIAQAEGKPAKIDFARQTYLEVPATADFDWTGQDFTIAARLKTKTGGTILAYCQPGPKWVPNGQAFFVREGRLCFDIGWVGVVTSRTRIDDGQWHNVAVSWQQAQRRVRLYVDGQPDGEGALAAGAALPRSVLRIGFTAPDFPQPQSLFAGQLAEVRFYQRRLTQGLNDFAPPAEPDKTLLARWLLTDAAGQRVADASGHSHPAELRQAESAARAVGQPVAAGFAPRGLPLVWSAADGRLRLKIPAGQDPLRFTIWTAAAPAAEPFDPLIPAADADLAQLTHGGPPRWPQRLETQAVTGAEPGPFAVDILTAPEANPWLAQTRFSGLDFTADGRIAVCSWDGDVWLVEPAAQPAAGQSAPSLRWQRIASGLFQPLGLKIVDGKIHVSCRDQLVVLHDLNGDGETDFYECLNNDHQVTEHFHEFAMGLQTDAQGNFYYAKSARHGLPAVVPHHGTLLRVSADGARTDILANGFRAANGVCLNPDGSFVVTDQEGFWNPKNRINWVTLDPSGRPKFYGNMLGYHDVTDPADSAMEPPLCWITNSFDRSPAELLWVTSDRWGPLKGSLLNLSYGYGKVFVVPHETVRGVVQGGLCELPLPTFPTGIMRGRFSPTDEQLYVCGLFAWAGNATYPGGLYRIRATGQPMFLPVGLRAGKSGLKITFTEPLDPAAVDAARVQVKTWSLKRTANYGSEHYDEKPLAVRGAQLSEDGRTVTLDLPELRPTWCMEIKYEFRSAAGQPVVGVVHNTIHNLGD